MRKTEKGEQRVALAQLGEHEGGEHHGCGGELCDRAAGAPALAEGFHQRVDEQQHAASGQDRAGHVEVRQRRAAALARDQAVGTGDDRRADRQVDEQDPAPARAL
jgi:hypothetical protein